MQFKMHGDVIWLKVYRTRARRLFSPIFFTSKLLVDGSVNFMQNVKTPIKIFIVQTNVYYFTMHISYPTIYKTEEGGHYC